MNKSCYHILASGFLLLFFLNVHAQDTTVVREAPTVEMADTVYESSVSHYQFKEADSNSKIQVRTVPQAELKKVESDEDYWYANLAPHREKKDVKPEEKKPGIFNKKWFDILFWILLIAGFLALLIWFLATGNISLFRRRPGTAADDIQAKAETENIFEINFEKEIQKAVEAADYRLAVRMLYLRTLRDLSLKNLISYTHEKTNTDYLFQLAGSPYYKTFFRLTRNFDYAWYGHFPVSQQNYMVIENEFHGFKQQLS